MSATRVKDRLVGAVAMLVVLVLGVVVAWWAVTAPAGEAGEGPAEPGPTSPPPDRRAPADLDADEVLRTVEVLGREPRVAATITHDIEGLPDGLVLQRVVVRDAGFRARLRGEDVRLVP